MSRSARKDKESSYFHIIVQGYEKQFIFSEKIFIEKYIKLIMEKEKEFDVTILAYCIMNNHAHILIYCENIPEMSAFMKSINSQYAVFYNKILKRVGYVFRDRFLSEPIKDERYLYNCLGYIHMNPVKANMVEFPNEYQYSSYNQFIEKSGIVNDKVLNLLFFPEDDYMDLFESLHLNPKDCLEYKNDFIRLEYNEASNIMSDVIKKYYIDILEIKDKNILRFLYNKFIELNISNKNIEKFTGVSYYKLKNLTKSPSLD